MNLFALFLSLRPYYQEIEIILLKASGMLLNLTVTPTGKRPEGRPRSRWEDSIRMRLK